MKKAKIIAAVAIVLSAAVLMGCSPRNAMSTLSTESDSETAEVFSLTKVLDLGTNYLVSLDYENAILQYIDIIQHDPKNPRDPSVRRSRPSWLPALRCVACPDRQRPCQSSRGSPDRR